MSVPDSTDIKAVRPSEAGSSQAPEPSHDSTVSLLRRRALAPTDAGSVLVAPLKARPQGGFHYRFEVVDGAGTVVAHNLGGLGPATALTYFLDQYLSDVDFLGFCAKH